MKFAYSEVGSGNSIRVRNTVRSPIHLSETHNLVMGGSSGTHIEHIRTVVVNLANVSQTGSESKRSVRIDGLDSSIVGKRGSREFVGVPNSPVISTVVDTGTHPERAARSFKETVGFSTGEIRPVPNTLSRSRFLH